MGYHQKPQYLSKTLEQDLLLPRVLFLRSPSVPSFFFSKSHLQAHFHLVDPLDSPEPTHSFLSRHAASVLALLCVASTRVSSETLSLLPSLKLVVASSAGLDHIDLGECRRRGITVTSAGQVFTEDVADFAVGLLIDVLRRVSASDGCVRARLWAEKRPFPLGVKLGGNRVGIVGLGRIGSEVAKRLIDFGCSIAYCSRKEKPSVPYPYYSTVSELATNSDVLILCCSLTKETHHIINKGVMEALGKEGVIINIGRGALIDEKELVKFLEQGQIRGAGLDVYENEPHVSQELFAMENVVLAPHAAVYTLESFAALQELVVGNLKAFFSNKPLLTPAQLE
ncbi:D-isomer specific 2-hydroxyacid dehydrogenase [Theobroma cacao]|nr:D-isomer specific 2-hydroxyacid dehydrogenase [Theobroma cacao]